MNDNHIMNDFEINSSNTETVIFFHDEYKINNILLTENEHFNLIATKKQDNDNTPKQMEINEEEKFSEDMLIKSDNNFNEEKIKGPFTNSLTYKAKNKDYFSDNLYDHQMTQRNFYSQNNKKKLLSLFNFNK